MLWLVLAVMTLWVAGALFFDFPSSGARAPIACFYLIGAVAVVTVRRRIAPVMLLGGFAMVLVSWLNIPPSNDRNWHAAVAQTARAEINGDRVTLHNFRNCDYRTETDYTPRWETRAIDLAKLRGVDLAITYWGPTWIAHPIVSFQFEDVLPVCFSIETRLEKGEAFSTLGGLYRRAELTYVCADERDVIRLRTNFRKGEEVFLYRTTIALAAARQRFLEYVTTLNELHEHPRWYNAVTTNCTTSIRAQRSARERSPWNWRLLVNGYLDELLWEQGALAGGLPFRELKQRAHINEAARAANDAPDFSQRIRAGRPGFAPVGNFAEGRCHPTQNTS